MDLSKATFQGYKRENGRIGVRNHVIILPVDDLSNAAAEAVANNIKGAMALPHPYGRLQFGADLELHFRTLIGTGANPNVAAVVVIGIEDGWTKLIVDGIAKTGKPVTGFGIEQHGDHDTIMRASKAAKEYVQWASELRCEERPLKDLWVSTKCGESDTTSGCGANPTVGNAFDKMYPHGVTMVFGETTELTGGEHLVAARCRNDEVRKKFQFVFDRYQGVIDRHKTSDLSDSQPTKGNIAGGLTTIEEKALGNIQKIGRKCMVDGVLDKAEMPTGPGLWFMDSSSAAAEMVTLCAASGYTVHFFPTGQGNVIGNPILPVIKLCANPRTVRTMSEHIDVDVSGLLRREMSPDEAGDKLLECMFRTANGRLTAAEALGHREFVLTRLYESAYMSAMHPFHLAFPVTSLDKARAFYGGLLGCPEGRSAEDWVDFDLYGHQIVAHLAPDEAGHKSTSAVDGDNVPVRHFGVVLSMQEWQVLADKLTRAGTRFVIEPHIRFQGQVGEQATMFFLDPCGNALEFKAFRDIGRLFAK